MATGCKYNTEYIQFDKQMHPWLNNTLYIYIYVYTWLRERAQAGDARANLDMSALPKDAEQCGHSRVVATWQDTRYVLLTQHLGRLHMLYYTKRSNASIFQCVLYPVQSVEAAAHGWTQRAQYLLGLGLPAHFASFKMRNLCISHKRAIAPKGED